MFTKLLIANRGEIACRIVRTAKRLGMMTVAIHTPVDANALHVRSADEAIEVENYLRQDLVLRAAMQSGADAIHPGYGFLSEHAGFARAVAGAGLTFVGPPADAIDAMGAKDQAKRLMEQAGVPVVPGYHGARQEPDFLKQKAYEIGYPVLVKAVAGGGGKGMRRVDKALQFEEALSGAIREAENAFGDGRVLIERYVAAPRHIEVQVFGDRAGRVESLYERDCTLQRRHQKIMEEAPAPGMTAGLRARMMDAACEAARAVGYVGAGTVEFIVDGSKPLSDETDFFFMEMNTRLQVEHPVTEMITGLDLVELQLRVAHGEALPDTPPVSGHAVEARLYAEDPFAGFLPASGRLERLDFGAGKGIRIDAGVEAGDVVQPTYDPMIAKIIAHGADRTEALDRLSAALRDTVVLGLETNLPMLIATVDGAPFRDFTIDTASVDRDLAAFLPSDDGLSDTRLAAAAQAMAIRLSERIGREKIRRDGAPDPVWDRTDQWTNAGYNARSMAVSVGGETRVIVAGGTDDRVLATSEDAATLWRNGRSMTVLAGRACAEADADADEARIVSPMHGRLIAVSAGEGAHVSRGDPVAIVEAMKMEHALRAGRDGTVKWTGPDEGGQVEKGAVLADIVATVAEDVDKTDT